MDCGEQHEALYVLMETLKYCEAFSVVFLFLWLFQELEILQLFSLLAFLQQVLYDFFEQLTLHSLSFVDELYLDVWRRALDPFGQPICQLLELLGPSILPHLQQHLKQH